MPEVPAAGRRRRRRWPWIVAALLLTAFLLRGPLLAPLVAHVAAAQIAAAIDGQASIAGAGGGWFTDARLSGITAEAPLGPVRQLHIRAVHATYGLGLLRGDLAALRSLTLDGVDAIIDLRGGDDDEDDGIIPPLLDLLPRPLPQVSLTGVVRLLLPERTVSLSGIHVATHAGDRLSLDVRVQVDDAEPLRVVARFNRPTTDTLRLEEAVVLGDATVETLELVLGRARQQLSASVQLGGGRLTLHADPTRARVLAEALDLSALPPSVTALLPAELGALRGMVAGETTALRSPQAQRPWNVAGSVRIQELIVGGAGPFTIAAQWHLGAGTVQVPRATIQGPSKGEAIVESLALSLTDGWPRTGTVRADIPDVRTWIPPLLHRLTLPATPAALKAELVLAGDALAIRSAQLAGAGVDLMVKGSLVAAPWRIEAADIALSADLAAVAALLPESPDLSGTLRLRLSGTLPFTGDPAVLLGTVLDCQVRGDGLMISTVAVDRVRIDARAGDGRLRLTHGEADIAGIGVALTAEASSQDAAWRGTIASLALTFPGVVATTAEAAAFTIGADGWSVGPLRFLSDAGGFSVEVRQQADAGLLVVDAPRIDLGRLGLPGLGGTATIAIDLSGDWSTPVAQVTLASDDLLIADRRARVDVHLTQDHHGIAIRRGRIDAGEDGRLMLGGTVPLMVGRAGLAVVPEDGVPGEIELTIPELRRWFSAIDGGSAHLYLRLAAPQDPQPVTGRLSFSGVRPRSLAEERPGLRPARLAVLNGSVDVRGAPDGVELEVAARADGRTVLTGVVRSPGVWAADTLTGGWRQRLITGGIDLAGLDLGRLAAALPGVQYLAGNASGRLAVSGTAVEPQWSGTLALSDVAAKFANDVPALAAGSAEVELAGRTVHLRQGVFDLGGAPVTVAGELQLAEPPHLALRVDGSNVLLVQRHDARLRADLALTLDGPVDRLLLAGRVVVTSAVFSPDISLWQGGGRGGDGRLVPFELLDPPLSAMRFDVVVSSAFTSRQDGVRVATSLVRAECDLDLHLRGRGAAPELSGRVVVRQGHVSLPFSTLRLSTGVIVFPEGDPFHPRLNAVATAQVRRWRVTLQAEGPLADPEIRASGDGLDERDALLLLSTGSTSAELSGEEGQRVALGRLGAWLGREAWDFLDGEADPDAAPGWINRLTLEFGRQVSEGGKDTIEAQVELTEPDSVPGLLLYGERDRWDDYNAGVILRFRWGGEP